MNRFVRLLLGMALLIVLAVAVPAFGKPGPLEEPRLLMLSYDRTLVDEGVWEGTVTGDVTGSLRAELTDYLTVGPLWLVEYNWIVDAGDQSFTVTAEGTLNTLSGDTAMTGEVIEGARSGAAMYEQGHLIDSEVGQYAGTIMIVDWVEAR